MITFVTFHADILDENLEIDTPLDNNNFYDYQQSINLMFKSVDKFHGDCQKVILTSLETNLSFLPVDIKVKRYPINSREIMLSRLVSQLDFLKNHDFESDVVLLDSDILINGNLESLFDHEFDLALTIRDNQEMPINGGIIYVCKKNPAVVINFFERLYLLYMEKYQEKSQWWGDQYALADIIGYKENRKFDAGIIDIDNIKVLLLPCEIYNFSPNNYESNLDVYELKDKKILHFKGQRKPYMSVYWQNYLMLDDSSDWHTKNYLLQQQILDLQTDRLILKDTIRSFQREKVELQSKNEKLQKSVERLQKYVADLQKHVADLQKHVADLQKHVADLQKYVADLQKSKFWLLREKYLYIKQFFSSFW
jgi:lipopolysaccharide biosynthesis glycosyltransferase